MSVDHEAIRSRLESLSVKDLDAVHALYEQARDLRAGLPGGATGFDAVETVRRVERALGLAVRVAQGDGRLPTTGVRRSAKHPRLVKDYFPFTGASAHIYSMASVSDEVFEKALVRCRERCVLPSRPTLLVTFAELLDGPRPVVVVPEPEPKKVRLTARGRRTVEHLAIQMNSIALGVAEIDPGEVDANAMAEVIDQAFEDIGTIRKFLREVNNHGRK